jgi:sigma54-dependent transcription regulator
VGGTKEIKVDVRIISATNKKLETEVVDGNFREDLFSGSMYSHQGSAVKGQKRRCGDPCIKNEDGLKVSKDFDSILMMLSRALIWMKYCHPLSLLILKKPWKFSAVIKARLQFV